ncbi:hypothetical protein HMPREF1544_12311 [Mucor circinelloides 1006PhL]|uniref:Uncharacterized protein n=1 Tax=Mucor circinelloides f. circinelloides (strain 1006PhL) TaxID=1220926 RepID=S2IYQ8_MUCC1|nr:hypothetical protein HMPREF1544_12311 [Mucor circinelloides 1006PhL]KAG1083471.1 hypothetical protein G6F42_022203 [Rhizopus arrhizus]
MNSDDINLMNKEQMASVLSKYNQMSSILTLLTRETPQSTEADFGQFHDVDDEDIVNQKKDMNTGSNVNDDDGNDDDDMLDLDDDMLDVDTNANADEDHHDVEFEFESEVQVENSLTDVLKASIEGFGMDATKVILLNACKIAGIDLYRTKDRESSSKIQELKVAEIRQKVTGFTHATLDSTIVLKAMMDTRANLLDNIQAVNIRIVGSEAAREIAQVRVFGYLYHMHINFEAARQQSDYFKGFLMELRTVVGLKSSPTVS